MPTKKLFIIAGESSGDLHGANLIKHLRGLSPSPVEIHGVGGDRMRDLRVLSFFDLAHFHVTGITSAIMKIPQYRRAAATIMASIEKARPDLIVLIDNPGFNLHLAKKIHALGIPIVYFIAPQVWAWAPKRVEKIKAVVKKVLVVFEFEKEFFEKHGVSAIWVGHPLKDILGSEMGSVKKDPNRIVLLPGSRRGELQMLFSVLLKAAALIKEKRPETTFSVIKASTLPMSAYEKELSGSNLPIEIVEKAGYQAIRQSSLAIACSGTVTLECAVLGTPVIITNRASLVTYALAKILIKVPYLGLPNLVLGKGVFPELLQFDATPKKISDAAVGILNDKAVMTSMEKACEEVSRKVGGTGASQRAAEEILKLL